MMILKKQFQVLVVSALAGSLFLTGCAKKSYVRQTVDAKIAPVDKKVTDLTAAVKDNAERTDAVDKKATQGIADAAAARTAATAAQTTATQGVTAAGAAQTTATQANTAAATANQGVTTANTRIGTVDTRVTTLTNSIDKFTPGPATKVMFKVGSSVLSPEAKSTLDGVASPVANQAAGYRVEIQGFASMDGAEATNISLSQARAENVQRYLVSKGVPVIRISMLGVGPIGDKKDKKAEREENRRVEVRVFTAAK